MNSLEFNYHKPNSLEEVCNILNNSKNAAVMAGGTDILVEIKKGLRQNDDIVSLKKISELKIIKEENDEIIIGAAVTHNEVKNSTFIKNNLSALSNAASNIGTDQIRNTGTIGGNLCTGASCCDMAPVLLVYGAKVEIISSSGKKIIPIKNFFFSHKKTLIGKGEIMTKIIVPIPSPKTGVCFLKFGLRDAASISVASVGVMIKLVNGVCSEAKIAIGAVAPAPKLCGKASELLTGLKPDDLSGGNKLLKVAEAAAGEAFPLDDIRGSADYRRNLIKTLTKRAILKAIKQTI
jgi:carbon-monoxide dehydrogenase medium subunit